MVCPFMEIADPRCARHFSLTNLGEAFKYCLGRHESCPIYEKLLGELAEAFEHERPGEVVPVAVSARKAS